MRVKCESCMTARMLAESLQHMLDTMEVSFTDCRLAADCTDPEPPPPDFTPEPPPPPVPPLLDLTAWKQPRQISDPYNTAGGSWSIFMGIVQANHEDNSMVRTFIHLFEYNHGCNMLRFSFYEFCQNSTLLLHLVTRHNLVIRIYSI